MCKICNNSTINKIINNLSYDFCPHCEFLYKNEIHHLDSNSEYNRYLQHNNNDNVGYVKYQEKFYEEIMDFIGIDVLDYGCGDNHILANIIKEKGKNVNYYDLYFYPDEKYKKSLYDAIILEEVIEHISNPLETLRMLLPLLKDGGKFIIRTLFTPEDVFTKNWWYLRDSTHISFFNLKTFKYISSLLSLSIIHCNRLDLIILQKV